MELDGKTFAGLFPVKPQSAKVRISQASNSLLLLKPQSEREFCGDRFRVFTGNGRLFSRASREDYSFQLFFPGDGDPQRVTQADKRAEDRIQGKSLQVLFDSFSA